MNAKLGKEKVFSQVVGCHTLHDISNENGEMVANYAISNDMFLTSTSLTFNIRKSILERGHPLIIKQQIKLTTLWLAKKK